MLPSASRMKPRSERTCASSGETAAAAFASRRAPAVSPTIEQAAGCGQIEARLLRLACRDECRNGRRVHGQGPVGGVEGGVDPVLRELDRGQQHQRPQRPRVARKRRLQLAPRAGSVTAGEQACGRHVTP
jgi:hypothetical protein